MPEPDSELPEVVIKAEEPAVYSEPAIPKATSAAADDLPEVIIKIEEPENITCPEPGLYQHNHPAHAKAQPEQKQASKPSLDYHAH